MSWLTEQKAEKRREARAHAKMARIAAMRLIERLNAEAAEREKVRYRKLAKVRLLLRRREVIRKARALLAKSPPRRRTLTR